MTGSADLIGSALLRGRPGAQPTQPGIDKVSQTPVL